MSRQTIDEMALARAPVETVWEVIADARGHAAWGPWEETSLDREGEPPPDGVGALRRFTSERRMLFRKVVTLEEVTVFEPPRTLAYKLLSGLPLRGYMGRVTLSEAGGGTEIRWHSEFDAAIPGSGPLFRRGLSDVIAEIAEHAAKEAERRSS